MAQQLDPQNKESKPLPEDGSSLRDALMNKAGEKRHPHVTPYEIGNMPPEEENALSKPLSFGGPSYLDRAVFCRQLATLIEVGIPMLKAMQMLGTRTANGRLRAAIADAARGIEEGLPIHQSLARNRNTFSPIVVNVVRVGEIGGILEDSLIRLAEIMETKAKMRRKIVAASAYPMVALAVAILVVGVIMIRAIPVFAEIYKESGSELPAPTVLIIGLSNFLTSAWPVLIVIAVLAAIGLRMWRRTPGGQRFFSWISLKLPILRGITQKIGVARFTRTLGGLVTAGVPLVDALRISADSNENTVIADALRDVQQHVEKGERMAAPLAHAGVFPPLVVDMIGIGEETGTLDRMLVKVADIYDAEVDAVMSGLSSIIEPLLIVVLGGIVIFIALAVLLPYFNLVNVVES